MTFVIFLVIAYLVGSIPFCFLLGKLKGVDLNTVGSGNSGATNLTRAAGPLLGMIGYLLDAVKGMVVIWVFWLFSDAPTWQSVLVGLFSVVGHIRPLYTKKGGKGVATGGGVFALFSVWGFVIALVVWILVVARTQYVSLGSILAAAGIAVYQLVSGEAWADNNVYITLFSFLLFFIIIYTHRENIRRLLRGRENKISLKKKTV